MKDAKGRMLKRFGRMLALVGSLCAAGFVSAAGYPNQPVRLIVGFPPGGPTDLMSWELAKGLQDLWRQSVLVENKPGAASQIAAVAAARAARRLYALSRHGHADRGAAVPAQ